MLYGPISTAICSGNQNAGDFVCRFFTEEVWDVIISETNCYAETCVSTTPTNPNINAVGTVMSCRRAFPAAQLFY